MATETVTEHRKLPADLANGIVTTLLNNLDFNAPKTTVSMLAATPNRE